MSIHLSRIHKLYLSYLLNGLIFWYGIEKIFMTKIGINAAGVGIATAVFLVFNLLFDIPAGILADRWSRKGMLIVSVIGLAFSSLIMGFSRSLPLYMFGEIFYGIYIVADSGTYQAIVYDILHEEERTEDYSKVIGRAQALFLFGIGISNIFSGFLARSFGYPSAYFLSIIFCVINILVILTLKEPTFHKKEQKEKTLIQMGEIWKTIKQIKILRVLTLIMGALAAVHLFEAEFGQLYLLRYTTSAELIGIIWALDSFAWSLGSLIAHRFSEHLTLFFFLTTLPFVLMSFLDAWFGMILFLLQAVAFAVLNNQLETLVQDNTPSSVRASMLSVLSFLGRGVAIPASFIFGWLIYKYNALAAVQLVAGILSVILLYWVFWARIKINEKQILEV